MNPRPRRYANLRERIEHNMNIADDGCWNWTSWTDRGGYGVISVATQSGRRTKVAHRVAYEAFVGPIPDGLQIDHLCRNRACVNPGHMEPVTSRENTLRGHTLQAENLAKTHCIAGHPYDEENTYIRSKGQRRCRLCDAAQARCRRIAARKQAS